MRNGASQVSLLVRNLPANTGHLRDVGLILGQEDPLEKGMAGKEIQPVHSEGDQPRDFFGRNDAKAETLVLWPPHVKR